MSAVESVIIKLKNKFIGLIMASPLDFKSIPINKLDQVTVSIDVENRDYGRRFTIKYKGSEKEVIFHELYRNARRLLKDSQKLSDKDIHDISAFVTKLEGVEKKAESQYEIRGNWYKFRTFFHRLFGGAFRGTHLGRLTKLHSKLEELAQPKFLQYLQNNQSNFDKHFHEPIEIAIGDRTFVASWKKLSGFEIWDKADPQNVTDCMTAFLGNGYRNFDAISNHAVSIFNEIGIELNNRVNAEDINASKRDEVVQQYERIYDLSKNHPVLSEPVTVNGKSYSIRMDSPSSGSFKINIQEIGNPKMLSLMDGSAEYKGAVSGIPKEHVPVLDELQRRAEDWTKIEAECNQINKEVRNRTESFEVCRDLSANDPIFHPPIVVDGIKYSIRFDATIPKFTIQKEPRVGIVGLLELETGKISFEGKPRGTIPDDLLPVCNELYARIQTRRNEIKLQNDKRDAVVALYQKLHALLPEHPALSGRVVVGSNTNRFDVKCRMDANGNLSIDIQQYPYSGHLKLLSLKNGSTQYENSRSVIPDPFMPVLDQLQKRVEDQWNDIEKILEDTRKSDQFFKTYRDLLLEAPTDPVFVLPSQIEIDGKPYFFRINTSYNPSYIRIIGEDVIKIESINNKCNITYNDKLSAIPAHIQPLINELYAKIQNRWEEIKQQVDKRDELLQACAGLMRENPLDPIFCSNVVIDGKSYQVHHLNDQISIRNIETQELLVLKRGETRLNNRKSGIPPHLLPFVNQMHSAYLDRWKKVDSINKKRDQFLDLLQHLWAIKPNTRIFQNLILIDSKTYSIDCLDGMFLTIFERKTGRLSEQLLTLSKNSPVPIPENMLPVINEIQKRLVDEIAAVEIAEIKLVPEIKGIFEDQEMFNKAAILLKTKNNVSGSVAFWEKDGVLNIQEKKYTGTQDGLIQITDGQLLNSIPEHAKQMLMIALFNTCTNGSYKNSKVQVSRDSINHIPAWHLNKLMNELLKNSNSFTVEYNGELGTDMGGLKREYVGSLASAISNSPSLFAEVDGSLKIPSIKRKSEDSVLPCDEKEAETYQNLGKLLSLCYISKFNPNDHWDQNLITTGRFFSDALFKAAFALSSIQLSKQFASKESELAMSKIILNHLGNQSSESQNLIKCIELLEPGKLEACLANTKASDDLKMALFLIGEDAGEPYMDDNFDPDVKKIKGDKAQFKEVLFHAIMTDKNMVNELKGVDLGRILDPIFQMVKGMKEKLNSWDSERTRPVDAFSSKIQGSIDRSLIANNIIIVGNDPVLNQKVVWLKEWIKDASDAEVMSFLKFVTGSSSLGEGAQIKVDIQAIPSPLIAVSTCNRSIHMSKRMAYTNIKQDFWDDTKDKFIRNLKSALVVDSFHTR